MVQSIATFDSSIQFSVQKAFQRLNQVSLKLATLQRINRGSDDPAGLIAAEQLSHEIAAVETANRSLERTRAFAQVADSALSGAGELLTKIETNLLTASNSTLSAEEQEALQYETDASLDALNRLGRTTLGGQQVFGQTAQFLAGPDPADVVTLELPAIDDGLGGESGVLADLRSGGDSSIRSGNLETAANLVQEARTQILSTRAEIGAFEKNVVESTHRALQGVQVSLVSARSAIRDADVAVETSSLVREMVLAQASVLTSRWMLQSRRATAGLITGLFNSGD